MFIKFGLVKTYYFKWPQTILPYQHKSKFLIIFRVQTEFFWIRFTFSPTTGVYQTCTKHIQIYAQTSNKNTWQYKDTYNKNKGTLSKEQQASIHKVYLKAAYPQFSNPSEISVKFTWNMFLVSLYYYKELKGMTGNKLSLRIKNRS